MEQSSITTRAKAHKLNNLNEGETPKSRDKNRMSLRRKKSINIENDYEAIVGQSARKKSLNAKVIDKSKKKKASSRKFNTVKGAISEDKAAAYQNENANCNESNKIGSKDKYADNGLSQRINSESLSKTPNKVQQKIIKPKEQSGMVTPKSTPIKLSLTPHRSTKTPKKSPISLNSPKTHSGSVSRLLKTPRKLSLTPRENLLQYNNSDSSDKKLRKIKKDSLRDVSVFNRNSPASSAVVKKKRSISTVKLKGIAHRFSKSPKIVLRSPSKKSKSPKLNISAHRKSRSKKSLAHTMAVALPVSFGTNTKLSSARGTSLPDGKNLSADKRRLLNSRLATLLTASQMRDVLAEPIVLLKKLSIESKPDMLLTTAATSDGGGGGGDGSDQLNQSIDAESADTLAESNASAHLRGNSRSSTAKATNRIAAVGNKIISPTRERNKASTPLMSSTPREESLAPLNPMSNTSSLSVAQDDIAYPNTRSRYTMNQSDTVHATPSFNLTDRSTKTIENVSKPSLLDVDIISNISQAHLASTTKQDTTYSKILDQTTESKKDQNNKDITYELKDPQTPGLRQIIRKRTVTDANLSVKENAKKSCRVRFANVKSYENGAHNSNGKPPIADRRQLSVTRDSGAQRKGVTTVNSARKSRRVFKFSRDSLASPLSTKSGSKMDRITLRAKSYNLGAASANLDKIPATPKGLESAENKLEKRSSLKKVPNFRRIHEKMFANSESVVDARKRLENRHLEFATKKVLSEVDVKSGMKLLPSDTTNGTYNRFGFKLRKAEATHVMLKKQTVFSRQKQQHETRTVLKSVRTNRRFELQMKARNINPI